MDDYTDEPLDRSADDSQACLILLQAAGIAMRGVYDAAEGDRRIETFEPSLEEAMLAVEERKVPLGVGIYVTEEGARLAERFVLDASDNGRLGTEQLGEVKTTPHKIPEILAVAATKALAHWSQKFDPAAHTAKSGGEAR